MAEYMNRKYFIAQTDLQWLFIREWWIVENLVTSVLWNIFELRLIDNNSALNFKLEVFIPHTVICTETNLSARNKTKWASAACCSSLQSLFSNSFMHRVCQYFEILPKWQNKKNGNLYKIWHGEITSKKTDRWPVLYFQRWMNSKSVYSKDGALREQLQRYQTSLRKMAQRFTKQV